MIRDEKRDAIEDEYGMPVERLMYHFYQEQEMSAGDISDELEEPRSSVNYWLNQSGIQMRSRKLTDVQRVLMLAYFDAGLGDGAIAQRLGCGRLTVNRHRKQIREAGRPTKFDSWVSAEDQQLLREIIDDAFGEINQ